MTATDALSIMDLHADALTTAECDLFMEAYETVYGVDSAPFWAQRYADVQYEGVELVQADSGH